MYWLLNLPVVWMAVVVFLATYLFAAGIYWVVISLAVNNRARSLAHWCTNTGFGSSHGSIVHQ